MVMMIGVLAILTGCGETLRQRSERSYEEKRQEISRKWDERQQTRIDAINVWEDRVRKGYIPADYDQQLGVYFATLLKDPMSAQFSQFVRPYPGLLCGAVNAKNGYGAYAGAEPFAAAFDEQGRLIFVGQTVRGFSSLRRQPQIEWTDTETQQTEIALLRLCGALQR